MTMLCWLFPGGQDGPLFNYKISGSWGVHLWVVSGKLFARFTKRDYSFTHALMHTELKPEDGWRFVGASYDSTSGYAKLWIDGIEVVKSNIGAHLHLATQDNVRMGVKNGDGRFFKGRIAQMQVYNVALSQKQIQAIRSKTQVAACQKPLGMERGLITDAQITASSQWDEHHSAAKARLHLMAGYGKQGAWSAAANSRNQWLRVDLGSKTEVKIIGTQGGNRYDQWVTSYKLEYGNNGRSFRHYRDPESGNDKVFTANKDKDTVAYHKLNLPMRVRYIRVIPWTWHNHITMRMELYGCPVSKGVPTLPHKAVTTQAPAKEPVCNKVVNVFLKLKRQLDELEKELKSLPKRAVDTSKIPDRGPRGMTQTPRKRRNS
ncbi:discoidin-1 subunit B/C-like isoform X1 [Stylophora pistillata]|uniref:discoidin-1 subunit B/C-like isoform X1 n=1 Tax=Stylophora pistillata TaxID=50429 RepID=UPI000C051442|nr:discoidin-1 subunit B/C-like isoform X1 [Stylophora pistillata]